MQGRNHIYRSNGPIRLVVANCNNLHDIIANAELRNWKKMKYDIGIILNRNVTNEKIPDVTNLYSVYGSNNFYCLDVTKIATSDPNLDTSRFIFVDIDGLATGALGEYFYTWLERKLSQSQTYGCTFIVTDRTPFSYFTGFITNYHINKFWKIIRNHQCQNFHYLSTDNDNFHHVSYQYFDQKIEFMLVGSLGTPIHSPEIFLNDKKSYYFHNGMCTSHTMMENHGHMEIMIDKIILLDYKILTDEKIIKNVIFQAIQFIEEGNQIFEKIADQVTKYPIDRITELAVHRSDLYNLRRNLENYITFILEYNCVNKYLSTIDETKCWTYIVKTRITQNIIPIMKSMTQQINAYLYQPEHFD